MLEVFICCSPADRDVASAISDRLRRNTEARVLVDDRATETIVTKWQGGTSSAAILLLLSPESVPPRVIRADWDELLEHMSGNSAPPIGCVLVRNCGYPQLLTRKNFFRWDGQCRQPIRAIEEWIMRLHQLPERRSFVPARLPWFEGRRDELEFLWRSLVDEPGTAVILNSNPGSGKTSLAQEFARQSAGHFRDALWIDCSERSNASIAADIAGQFGVVGEHRVLLVLDDARPAITIPADPDGRASVLITTRSEELPPSPGLRVLRIAPPPEALVTAPDDPVDRRLWHAMAVCRRGGFALDFVAEIAQLRASEAHGACTRLIEARVADPLDDVARRLRLNVRPAASLESERKRHAEIIEAALARRTTDPGAAQQYIPEFLPAFQWAATADWHLAASLARRAYAFLRDSGRVAEGVELLLTLRDRADAVGDWDVSDECSSELSWVRNTPYRAPNRGPVEGAQLALDFA